MHPQFPISPNDNNYSSTVFLESEDRIDSPTLSYIEGEVMFTPLFDGENFEIILINPQSQLDKIYRCISYNISRNHKLTKTGRNQAPYYYTIP